MRGVYTLGRPRGLAYPVRSVFAVLDTEERMVPSVPAGVEALDHGIDACVVCAVKEREVVVAPEKVWAEGKSEGGTNVDFRRVLVALRALPIPARACPRMVVLCATHQIGHIEVMLVMYLSDTLFQ